MIDWRHRLRAVLPLDLPPPRAGGRSRGLDPQLGAGRARL